MFFSKKTTCQINKKVPVFGKMSVEFGQKLQFEI